MLVLNINIDDFVKSPSAVRQAHGPEQGRRAALRFIFSFSLEMLSRFGYECKTAANGWN